ncbi:Uncharacterized protein TCM_019620 [Theobroma cacao]|uniref:DUF7745 domain-containing protein n=1 Tax=Theobroma cacao TaxID=3641 RepID=A0A061EI57_THECC|nr:Uncharacterized protein TCM_019620 [Theobroma cacao]
MWHRLDLYLPTNRNGPKPVVVFVTGGAWIIGGKPKPVWVTTDRGRGCQIRRSEGKRALRERHRSIWAAGLREAKGVVHRGRRAKQCRFSGVAEVGRSRPNDVVLSDSTSTKLCVLSSALWASKGRPGVVDLGSCGPPSWANPSLERVDLVAYMESSWPSSGYDGIYEVTQHMASVQQSEGDCLSKDHFSSLPDRVHLDLKQNDFIDLLNIWDNYIMKHRDIEQGQLVMALGIYGLVIFPKVLGHIEVGIIDFFQQVINKANPSPSILAETLRSLNYCRRKGEGRFVGCSQLLSIWIASHFECKIWHDQRVKDVVYPKEDALCGPVDPKPRDALLESELARKKSEAENASWKQRYEDLQKECEKMKREVSEQRKKVRRIEGKYESLNDKFSATTSELQREIQVKENRGNELQTHNDELRRQVRFQQESIQLLRQEYEELEGVMTTYQQEYECLKQQSTRIQEWGESYRQAYIEKHNQMDYLVWQMREVAYKARSMAWKTDILKSQIFPVGKQEQQLIKYLDERARIMEEEQRERMDRMERAQEEMREQLTKMMELMMSFSKGKRAIEEPAPSENPPAQDSGNQRDDPSYPPGFTPPHAQTSQRVHPQVMPSVYYNAPPPLGHQPTHRQFRPYSGA